MKLKLDKIVHDLDNKSHHYYFKISKRNEAIKITTDDDGNINGYVKHIADYTSVKKMRKLFDKDAELVATDFIRYVCDKPTTLIIHGENVLVEDLNKLVINSKQ